MATQTRTLDEDPFWIRDSSLDVAARELLLAAARLAWPYARRSAWSYLHDETLAAELLEKAVEIVTPYVSRGSTLPSSQKLVARLRSQVRRLARQEAHRRRHEKCIGTIFDLATIAPSHSTDVDERLFLEKLLELLSPFSRIIAQGLRMGRTFREIAKDFDSDHSTVSRAFRRDVDAALTELRSQRR